MKFDGAESPQFEKKSPYRGPNAGGILDGWISRKRPGPKEDRTQEPSQGRLAHMGLVGFGLIAVGSTVKNSFWRDIGAAALTAVFVLSFLLLL